MDAISRLQLREDVIVNHVTLNLRGHHMLCYLRYKLQVAYWTRPGFFNDWYTTKVFQVSAKYPVSKDRLTIIVMPGRSESRWHMTDLISLFSYPSHMSLYDGCMTISSRDKSAFKIVPQMIHIIHKPIGIWLKIMSGSWLKIMRNQAKK